MLIPMCSQYIVKIHFQQTLSTHTVIRLGPTYARSNTALLVFFNNDRSDWTLVCLSVLPGYDFDRPSFTQARKILKKVEIPIRMRFIRIYTIEPTRYYLPMTPQAARPPAFPVFKLSSSPPLPRSSVPYTNKISVHSMFRNGFFEQSNYTYHHIMKR